MRISHHPNVSRLKLNSIRLNKNLRSFKNFSLQVFYVLGQDSITGGEISLSSGESWQYADKKGKGNEVNKRGGEKRKEKINRVCFPRVCCHSPHIKLYGRLTKKVCSVIPQLRGLLFLISFRAPVTSLVV